ncbi:hypothetical protein HQN89_13680 [Paenibacillus frigoriresistens]|uniref:hypothetical protein n=1 Tax=Paenibacillus alginolyticus TaxID=59839 RepID=UPI0015655A62|nr:hypothetical protein [Paenibacillus frigoriresistens]NRF92055.1 hypothetical protein [Paenibacillus frigoriresistens]
MALFFLNISMRRTTCGCLTGPSTPNDAIPTRDYPLPAELLYFVQQFGGFLGQIGFLLYGVQQFAGNFSEIGV